MQPFYKPDLRNPEVFESFLSFEDVFGKKSSAIDVLSMKSKLSIKYKRCGENASTFGLSINEYRLSKNSHASERLFFKNENKVTVSSTLKLINVMVRLTGMDKCL